MKLIEARKKIKVTDAPEDIIEKDALREKIRERR